MCSDAGARFGKKKDHGWLRQWQHTLLLAKARIASRRWSEPFPLAKGGRIGETLELLNEALQ